MTESSPVVPSVGAVPVEVPAEAVEAVAKEVADTVSPPVEFERWDRESRDFVMERSERGPDDQAYVSFVAGDGIRSTRGATYREIVAAAYPLIAAWVRAEGQAERNAELRRWIDVGQGLEAEKRLALAERDEHHRNWQAAEQALTRVRTEERQRIAALVEAEVLTDDDVDDWCGNHDGWNLAMEKVLRLLAAAGSAAPVATPEPSDETRCHRCGGKNCTWSAPSPLWNEVMRGGDINGPWQWNEIICPPCFAELAETVGIAARGWRFTADQVLVPLATSTPSGRVWDESKQLWVEPVAIPTEPGLPFAAPDMYAGDPLDDLPRPAAEQDGQR